MFMILYRTEVTGKASLEREIERCRNANGTPKFLLRCTVRGDLQCT